MSNIIEMEVIEKCVIVAYKGFLTADNIRELKRNHLSFIIPLRRNSILIPDTDSFTGVFKYDGKPVKYWKLNNDLYMFEDPVLSSEEEKDFLLRIEENKMSRKQVEPIFAPLYHYNSIEIFSSRDFCSFVSSTGACDPLL